MLMNTAHTIVTILAAAWVGFSAYALLTRASWVIDSLAEYGVPMSWWPWLGGAKAAGAIGLLVGLAFTPIGIAATIGVVLYFLGAIATVVRAHVYGNIPFPLLYLVPVVVAAALGAAA
jgi:hypothetical protein